MDSTDLDQMLERLPRDFGKVVRSRREQLGMTQIEMGERSGLHRTYICDVEHASRNVSLQTLCRIARSLDMMPSALLARAEELSQMSECSLTKD